MGNFGQAAVGLILLLVVVGGLLYIFYSRSNSVEKNGYGALAMLALVSMMIPVFWIMENSNESAAKERLQVIAVERGMQLYTQVCTFQCYGIKDGKIVNPTYNGFTIADLNSNYGDDQLHGLISAGTYNPNAATAPENLNSIARSERFGGQLSANDIEYIFSFIRSADQNYLKKQGFKTPEALENGFTALPKYLEVNNTALYNQAVSFADLGQFGTAVDRTKDATITINIENPKAGQRCDNACFELTNVKVKVGTTITWVNKSSNAHSVTAIEGKNTASPKPNPQVFDSGDVNKLIQTNGTFTYKVTEEAYNANSDHTVVYYCRVHPKMLAQLTIVK